VSTGERSRAWVKIGRIAVCSKSSKSECNAD